MSPNSTFFYWKFQISFFLHLDCRESTSRRTSGEESKNSALQGNLNVELGMMWTDEDDIEELMEIYGPLCWQGNDKDPGGFNKTRWFEK